MLKSKKIKRSDIGLIAVNVGPGSFTGVRVGVAAARAIAQGLKRPLVGISGLEAMAYQAWQKQPSASVISSCLPALAGEMYFACYKNKKGTPAVVAAPTWGTYQDFTKALKKWRGAHIVGDRADNIKASLPNLKTATWLDTHSPPHPKAIAELGISRYLKSRMRLNYKDIHPLYLQPSWAERK